MSSAAYFTFEEPIPLEKLLKWGEPWLMAYSPPGGNIFYIGGLGRVEVTFWPGASCSPSQDNRPPREATRVTVSTFIMGDLDAVADVALSLWGTFGGSLTTSPEIRDVIIRRATGTTFIPNRAISEAQGLLLADGLARDDVPPYPSVISGSGEPTSGRSARSGTACRVGQPDLP